MTAYAVAKLLNLELKKFGFKEVPTQMMYNYVRNNLIRTFESNGQVLIKEEVAKEFVEKFVAKKRSRVTK